MASCPETSQAAATSERIKRQVGEEMKTKSDRDGRTDGGKVKLIINFPRQINKKKRGKMFLFFFLFFCLEDDDDDEKEKMKGNKVQKEKKKGASA